MQVQNPRVTSSNPRVTSTDFTIYEFKSKCYKFKSTSCKFKSTRYEFKSASYEFKFISYEFKSTTSRIIKSMKTHVNSLKSSSFHKIISPKLLGKFVRQRVRSVSRNNLLFYFSTTPWIKLQQEAEWDLNFPQKSHLYPDDFGEIRFFFCF